MVGITGIGLDEWEKQLLAGQSRAERGAYLVLAKEGQVKQNLQGLRVCRHDNQVRDSAIQGLGGLVGALLELLVVACLLHQVEDCHREFRVCQWIRLGINCCHLSN